MREKLFNVMKESLADVKDPSRKNDNVIDGLFLNGKKENQGMEAFLQ